MSVRAFPTGVVLLTVVLSTPAVYAAESRVLSRPGDKSRGEDEQIRRREEWFALSRGLDRTSRPDRLRAAGASELQQAQLQRRSTLALAGETWESLGPLTMTMLNWTM